MAISAWDNFAQKDSPDGRFTAIYDEAMEVGMGAPTCGVLRISDKATGHCIAELAHANASIVWASDSSALAFPRWTPSRKQQLVVVRIPEGLAQSLEGEFRVLQLDQFHQGIIEGIDSPIYHPSRICVKV